MDACRFGRILCFGGWIALMLSGCSDDLEQGELKIEDGYLQVAYDNSWWAVCDNGFGRSEAEVACRSMGLGGGSSLQTGIFTTQAVALDQVSCGGCENELTKCHHNPFGEHTCSAYQGVSFTCEPVYTLTELQLLVPSLIVMTGATVWAIAMLFAGASKEYAAKYLVCDSVDQLLSIYFLIWCHIAGANEGIKFLAWMSCLVGLPSFLISAYVYLLTMGSRKNNKLVAVVNASGLVADLFSVCAVAIFELTSELVDYFPVWLRAMDLLWSILSIVAEAIVLTLTYQKHKDKDGKAGEDGKAEIEIDSQAS